MARTKQDDIRGALKKLRDEANDKEIEVLDLIARMYESLQESKEQALAKVQDSAQAVNTSVHLHPWNYIGGAALCGFLAGFLLRR